MSSETESREPAGPERRGLIDMSQILSSQLNISFTPPAVERDTPPDQPAWAFPCLKRMAPKRAAGTGDLVVLFLNKDMEYVVICDTDPDARTRFRFLEARGPTVAFRTHDLWQDFTGTLTISGTAPAEAGSAEEVVVKPALPPRPETTYEP